MKKLFKRSSGNTHLEIRGEQQQSNRSASRFGLEILETPEIQCVVDIVAVHGLNGDRIKTWSHGEPPTGVLWLRDLLPEKIPNARIMTFGYNADILGNTSAQGIVDNARKLLVDLRDQRRVPDESTRPLVLIGHSLGGIVIKKALRIANNEPRYDEIAKSVVGLAFFGTPHRGSQHADWAVIASKIAGATFLRPAKAYLKVLKRNSEALRTISDDFRPLSEQYHIVSFWEGDITPGLETVVVERHSALLDLPWEEEVPLRGDHRSICRFSGENDDRFGSVWKAIERMVLSGHRGRSTNTKEIKAAAHFMVPFSRNKQFLGGESNFERINLKILGSGHCRVALYGLGGVGKTQNALDYIYRLQGSTTSVFWIHSSSKSRFEQDYRKLAAMADLPEHGNQNSDIRPAVKNWLERPESGDWVLVLDNADNKLDFFSTNGSKLSDSLAKFIPQGGKGVVIITTRDYEVADELADRNTMHLKLMHLNNARRLFLDHSLDTLELNENLLPRLLELLEFLPLAIVQAAAYLRMMPTISLAQYIKLFESTKETQTRLLSRPIKDLRRDHESTETIFATFAITFKQIKEQSPLAASLLRLIGCIDRQGIPHELLAASVIKNDKYELALEDEQLSENESISEDQLPRDGYLATKKEFSFQEALGRLINLSLLTVTEEGSAYEMHRLVHHSITASLLPQEHDTALDKTAQALLRVLPPTETFEYWSIWKEYLPHALFLASGKQRETLDFADIFDRTGWYIFLGRRISSPEIVSIARRAVSIRESLLGPQHLDTLRSSELLASVLREIRKYDEAEKLQRQALEGREKVLGGDHPDTLLSLSNLGSTLRQQGKYDEAEQLYQQVIERSENNPDYEKPDAFIYTYWNLAIVHEEQKLYVEAERECQRAYIGLADTLGSEHPKTLGCLSDLERILSRA